jgi:hypothetical protein
MVLGMRSVMEVRRCGALSDDLWLKAKWSGVDGEEDAAVTALSHLRGHWNQCYDFN